ncbi:hypothetical protein JYU34_003541 [Plutella xylostella]|uniref:Uncharacterized protein n=1 Tax=Plutella xylostella TaxID=51655 RepID=A0ABQ7R0A6_PLUXY|nr:hypothetical protein JYU34_003541 [Plutella xylostella]
MPCILHSGAPGNPSGRHSADTWEGRDVHLAQICVGDDINDYMVMTELLSGADELKH